MVADEMPATVMGQLLFAAIARVDGQLDVLVPKINHGIRDGWSEDDAAVVDFAAEIAVTRILGTKPTQSELDHWWQALSDSYPNETFDREKMTAVLREAWGHAHVTDGVSKGDRLGWKMILTGEIARRNRLDRDVLIRLILDAERMSYGRGFAPST